MFTGPRILDDVHATLNECWQSHDHVPESIRAELAIAVGEIVANIIEHAAQDGPIRVEMSIEVLADQVQVSFTDDGIACPVDPETAQMPDAFTDRGRGLAMIRAVVSKLSYRRSGSHNHWKLISRPFP